MKIEIKNKAKLSAISAVGAMVFVAFGAENDVRSLAMQWGDAVHVGAEKHLTGCVTHVSAIRDGVFVVADVQTPTAGVVVFADGARPEEGDIVKVYGKIESYLARAAVRADAWQKIAEAEPFDAPVAKYHDFRSGRLHARRLAFVGVARSQARESGGTTLVGLRWGRSEAFLRLPPSIDAAQLIGKRLRVTGCVFDDFDEKDLRYKGSVVEVTSGNDIILLDPEPSSIVLYALVAALVVLVIILAVLWIRTRAERARLKIVTLERKRMAADLHDTVEQHLATAKVMLSAMQMIPALPQEAKDAAQRVAAVLVHAKIEVRDAVNDLRSDKSMTLHEALAEIGKGIEKSGAARVRMNIATLDGKIAPSRLHDLVSIVREAATNAIKHGKARNIAIVADRRVTGNGERGTESGFVLRVLNDGKKFDVASTLGQGTGHFGISGMKERATRSGFALDFVSDEKWCGVKITIKT